MNFINKIINKPKDGEPELRQAHTGQELAARYDENLKRWIFPGEENSGPPQELAPPPMISGPAIPSSGPKRFSGGGRALYTDPFAEFQGHKPETTAKLASAPSLLLLPGAAGADAPFPVEVPSFPVAEEASGYTEPHATQATSSSPRHSERSPRHAVTLERHDDGEVVYRHETEVVSHDGYVHREDHEYFTEQPTELHEPEPETEYGVVGTDQATSGSTVNDNDISRMYQSESATVEDDQRYLEATVPDLNSGWETTRPVLPHVHVTSPLGPQGTELSAIDPVEETGLSGTSYLNRGTGDTPLVTRISLPRKESRDNWFGNSIDEDSQIPNKSSSVEISILGHPVGIKKNARSMPPLEEFTETLAYLKTHAATTSSQDAIVSVRRAINQCVDLAVVKEDPAARALFCEAIEAVSFSEGSIREAAKEAVSVLVECLEESSIIGDTDEDRTTATAALGALWNLTFTARDEGNDLDLLNSTKKAMLSFPHDEEVQTNASGLLINLAADRQGQRHVLNLGLVDALVSAVQLHDDNPNLVEHACQLLAMISARKDLREQLPAKYYNIVIDVAAKFDDPSVTRWCNWLKSLTKA